MVQSSGTLAAMPAFVELAQKEITKLADTELAAGLGSEARALAGQLGFKPLAPTPRSLDSIVAAFPEEIPQTLFSKLGAAEDPATIDTILTPKVDQKLARGFRKLSQDWSSMNQFPGSKVNITDSAGRLTLPELTFSADSPGVEAAAGYVNSRVRMGEAAFQSPFDPERAGIAVHETTHHEQAYLALGLKADQLGIKTGRASLEQLEKLTNAMQPYHLGLSDDTTMRFLELRAGRQLGAAASSRAEQLLSSNKELFDLPFNPRSLKAQLDEIGKIKSLIDAGAGSDAAKTLLNQFLNPKERAAMLSRIFGADDIWQGRRLGSTLAQLQGTLGDLNRTLQLAEESTLQKKSLWKAVYRDALHEREARFNQFIAQESLADFLASDGR